MIAVVTDALAPFHRELVDHLEPHFSAAGYGTLAVAGRDIRTDRLVGHSVGGAMPRRFGTGFDVRGAAVVCGATPPDMSPSAVKQFFAQLTEGPTVSVGITLPGIPSVTIGWQASIDELMDHVTEDPTRRRFAFVRGFPNDPHSEQREAGFRAGLARAGLPVDEQMIVSGHYSVADAFRAVDGLLRDGHRFDGVVAANDDMAIGVMAALNRRGISVPEDVIVAGFDASLAAFQAEPPLTSGILDTAGLAEAAANRLVEAIEAKTHLPASLNVEIESGVVRRASTRASVIERSPNRLPDSSDFDSILRERITTRLETARAPQEVDIAQLIDAVVETMVTGNGAFEQLQASSFESTSPFGRSDLPWIRHVIAVLRSVAIELNPGDIPEAGLTSIIQQIAQIEDRVRPVEKLVEVERQTQQHLQERLVMRLAACSEQASLWHTLRTGLRALGMTNAWVAVDERIRDVEGNDGAGDMRLLFSLGDVLPDDGVLFDRRSVLPRRFEPLLEQGLHVLVPLRAGESDVGYIVIEPSGGHLLELEAIALGIAQVLRHVDQVEDLESQASRLRIANGALDVLARRDALTGLANRKRLVEHLEEKLGAADEDTHFDVLFIDLDGFKLVNDTLGHAAGDEVLRVVAGRLGELLDENDFLARLGGDEFVLVLHGDRPALDVGRSAVEAVAEPVDVLGCERCVSASVGIARFPDEGTTTDQLISNADAAMYAAKAAGRNRMVHYRDLGESSLPQGPEPPVLYR